jgi:hypothetical protein
MINKIGINPEDQDYMDESTHVTGVYCWRASHVIKNKGVMIFASLRPFHHVIKLKHDPIPLTDEDWKSVSQQRDSNLTNITANSSGAHLNKLLRKIGYDVLIDTKGFIASNNECVILDLAVIDGVKTFENRTIHGTQPISSAWEGNISSDIITANANPRQLLSRAITNNKLLDIKSEQHIINKVNFNSAFDTTLKTAVGPFNRTELSDLLLQYVNKILVPKNKKFHLNELNSAVLNIFNQNYSNRISEFKMSAKKLEPTHYTENAEILSYLKDAISEIHDIINVQILLTV